MDNPLNFSSSLSWAGFIFLTLRLSSFGGASSATSKKEPFPNSFASSVPTLSSVCAPCIISIWAFARAFCLASSSVSFDRAASAASLLAFAARSRSRSAFASSVWPAACFLAYAAARLCRSSSSRSLLVSSGFGADPSSWDILRCCFCGAFGFAVLMRPSVVLFFFGAFSEVSRAARIASAASASNSGRSSSSLSLPSSPSSPRRAARFCW
mmetsp:Transcript_3597/g.10250  ORF Transcript_3597/g.10250 Transcript_3597/m.10250 type:complete len:211 (+) Transcript_3597:104-736(+)